MNVLIVGLGSIGRRHLANLRLLLPEARIVVWRTRSDSQEVPRGADCVVFSLDAALAAKPTAAIVATPAPLHVATATALAHQGIHLFIEKPLSHNLDQVDELIRLCEQKHLSLMVGYCLRFSPSLQLLRAAVTQTRIGRVLSLRAEVGQFLPTWRPGSDYRTGVSGRADLGGGVIFELSHELDYVRWIGGEIRCVYAEMGNLSDLDVNVEDVAEILARFDSGAIGSIHLDMVQQPKTRSCRIIGTAGTLTWDGSCGAVRLYSADEQAWVDLGAGDGGKDMYIAELRHFLDCVAEE